MSLLDTFFNPEVIASSMPALLRIATRLTEPGATAQSLADSAKQQR